MDGFKKFILRGNVVDLAVGVVIGAAFATVVTALTASFITPLIAAIFGKPDFGGLSFTINDSTFTYGLFINALISFLLIATAVYFLVVLPVNMLNDRYGSQPDPEAPKRDCPECLTPIPEAARRCSACTSEVAPV